MSANGTQYKSQLEPEIYEDDDNRETLINAGSTWENSALIMAKGVTRLVESVDRRRRRRAHKIALNSKRIAGPINLFAISAALHVSAARIDRTPTLRINAVIRNEAPMTARREKTALARRKPRDATGGGVLSRTLQDVYSRERKYLGDCECPSKISTLHDFSIYVCVNHNIYIYIFFLFLYKSASVPSLRKVEIMIA